SIELPLTAAVSEGRVAVAADEFGEHGLTFLDGRVACGLIRGTRYRWHHHMRIREGHRGAKLERIEPRRSQLGLGRGHGAHAAEHSRERAQPNRHEDVL